MSEKSEEFIRRCMESHTSVSAFIKLFNLWCRLTTEERGQVIDSEIAKGRLLVEK